jgi:galactitol 2-dehydrogenase (L-tagatose-forming)
MDYLARFRLDDAVAAVTGAASGIGLEVCRALGSAGARIALLDRDAEGLARAEEDLARRGIAAASHAVDVTDPQAVNAAASEIAAMEGRVDVLVNSAGIARLNEALNTPDEEWRQVFDVNVNGTFWASRAFGAHMIARGSGSIVNLGSMSGVIINRPQHAASYMASKGAVHMLTKALAAEWADKGVRVNALAPGYVGTEMTLKMREQPELFDMWMDMTPMRRCGEPSEIASAALYLASPAASFVTGAIFSIDGGYTVW